MILNFGMKKRFSWPPSLGWAFTCVPLVKYIYRTFWHRLVSKYEIELDRIIYFRGRENEANDEDGVVLDVEAVVSTCPS